METTARAGGFGTTEVEKKEEHQVLIEKDSKSLQKKNYEKHICHDSGEVPAGNAARALKEMMILCRENKKPRTRRFAVIIGQYIDKVDDLSFDVTLRFDNNSNKRCVELEFVELEGKLKSFGYVLIEIQGEAFVFRGMHIKESMRGRGLSNLFMAIWLKVCIILQAEPRTIKMEKPLLMLVLLKYGFVPRKRSLSVEVSTEPGDDGRIVLWSSTAILTSLFSKRYLRTQRMVIAEECPSSSKTVYTHTPYGPPADMILLAEQVEEVLQGRFVLYVDYNDE